MGFDEVDELLAFEETGPHVVALPLRDDELHGRSEFGVPFLHDCGVLVEGHQLVGIAMDGEQWNLCLGEGLEAVDGIVRAQLIRESGGVGLECGCGAGDAGIAGDVGDRIDARPCGDLFWVISGPRKGHESASASREKDGFPCEVALLGEFLMELGVEDASIGTSIGFAHVDAGNRDACIEELLEHPSLRAAG